MKYSFSYLISIQFLGFRFHGWQKQKIAMSLHEMMDKTLSFVLEGADFKTLGSGRTDAKVSANQYFFQLFTNSKVDKVSFVDLFNSNAPMDLKAIEISEVKNDFNSIQSVKLKEYHYYFSFGQKNHPFAASLLVGFMNDLDIEIMKQGAKLFEGVHYFHKYCTKPSKNTVFKREITSCIIEENTILKANFFPKNSYVLKVKGKGFLRYQIRLMMGVLVELGKGNLDFSFIKDSLLETNDKLPLKTIAPGSGLQLYSVEYKDFKS